MYRSFNPVASDLPHPEDRRYPAEPRPIPDDQISVTRRPDEPGPDRTPHATSAADSYRLNLVRTRADGTLNGPVFDITPQPNHASHSPAFLFGPQAVVAHVISGVNRLGEPANLAQNQASLRALMAALIGLDARPAVILPPDREWIEPGAVVINGQPDRVLTLAREHGQPVVLRWGTRGLTALSTVTGEPIEGAWPVPVRVDRAATGCPMLRGRHDWCRNDGGWFTGRALAAARTFETHRQLLVSQLGCDVCQGGPNGRARYGTAPDWLEPTREGSWGDPIPFESSAE